MPISILYPAILSFNKDHRIKIDTLRLYKPHIASKSTIKGRVQQEANKHRQQRIKCMCNAETILNREKVVKNI